MKTVLDSRIPLDKLASLEKDLKSGQYIPTNILIERYALGSTSINGLRQLMRTRPDLAEAVFKDQLSLCKAIRFFRNGTQNIPELPTRRNGRSDARNSDSGLGAVVDNPKLRTDLLAWIAITRELLDSMETVLR